MEPTGKATELGKEVTQTKLSMEQTIGRLCETNPKVLNAVFSPLLTTIAERAVAGFEGVEEDLVTVLAAMPDGYVVGVSQNPEHHLDVGVDDGDGPTSWDRLYGKDRPAETHQWFYTHEQIFVSVGYGHGPVVALRTSTDPSRNAFITLSFKEDEPNFLLEVVATDEANRRLREQPKV